jgi:hypothetical protein
LYVNNWLACCIASLKIKFWKRGTSYTYFYVQANSLYCLVQERIACGKYRFVFHFWKLSPLLQSYMAISVFLVQQNASRYLGTSRPKFRLSFWKFLFGNYKNDISNAHKRIN